MNGRTRNRGGDGFGRNTFRIAAGRCCAEQFRITTFTGLPLFLTLFTCVFARIHLHILVRRHYVIGSSSTDTIVDHTIIHIFGAGIFSTYFFSFFFIALLAVALFELFRVVTGFQFTLSFHPVALWRHTPHLCAIARAGLT